MLRSLVRRVKRRFQPDARKTLAYHLTQAICVRCVRLETTLRFVVLTWRLYNVAGCRRMTVKYKTWISGHSA